MIARIVEITDWSVIAFAGTWFLLTLPIWCGRRFSRPETNSSRPNE